MKYELVCRSKTSKITVSRDFLKNECFSGVFSLKIAEIGDFVVEFLGIRRLVPWVE
jgi:hypothetical protein